MTLHPLYAQEAVPAPQQEAGEATAYDTLWAGSEVPVQETTPFERTMLAEDKLYVVLAVVLIIWFGIVFFLYRTDRKLTKLERSVGSRIPDNEL